MSARIFFRRPRFWKKWSSWVFWNGRLLPLTSFRQEALSSKDAMNCTLDSINAWTHMLLRLRWWRCQQRNYFKGWILTLNGLDCYIKYVHYWNHTQKCTQPGTWPQRLKAFMSAGRLALQCKDVCWLCACQTRRVTAAIMYSGWVVGKIRSVYQGISQAPLATLISSAEGTKGKD